MILSNVDRTSDDNTARLWDSVRVRLAASVARHAGR